MTALRKGTLNLVTLSLSRIPTPFYLDPPRHACIATPSPLIIALRKMLASSRKIKQAMSSHAPLWNARVSTRHTAYSSIVYVKPPRLKPFECVSELPSLSSQAVIVISHYNARCQHVRHTDTFLISIEILGIYGGGMTLSCTDRSLPTCVTMKLLLLCFFFCLISKCTLTSSTRWWRC